MQDALPEAGQVLTINLLAGNITEAYAKARLDARRFFVDGEISLHLVEAELELVTAPTNARGEPIHQAQFGCKFTAWVGESGQPLNVIHLPDVALALLEVHRILYALPGGYAPSTSEIQDAATLVSALEHRGYRLVRKDTDDA